MYNTIEGVIDILNERLREVLAELTAEHEENGHFVTNSGIMIGLTSFSTLNGYESCVRDYRRRRVPPVLS